MAEKELTEIEYDLGTKVAVREAQPKIKQPPLYKVVLLNDDFTPMDFVVSVLGIFFHLDEAKAEQIMWKIHKEGKAICGIYTKDVAETRAMQVNEYARSHSYPLLCIIEVEQ